MKTFQSIKYILADLDYEDDDVATLLYEREPKPTPQPKLLPLYLGNPYRDID